MCKISIHKYLFKRYAFIYTIKYKRYNIFKGEYTMRLSQSQKNIL